MKIQNHQNRPCNCPDRECHISQRQPHSVSPVCRNHSGFGVHSIFQVNSMMDVGPVKNNTSRTCSGLNPGHTYNVLHHNVLHQEFSTISHCRHLAPPGDSFFARNAYQDTKLHLYSITESGCYPVKKTFFWYPWLRPLNVVAEHPFLSGASVAV